MVRSVTMIAVLLWFALAQPAAAHALADHESSPPAPAMCVDAPQLVWPLTDALVTGSVEARRTLDSAPSRQDDNQPAWCVSPDDPRCSQRETSAPLSTQRASLAACDFMAVRQPALARDELAVQHGFVALGAPRRGVTLSLERPPRAR